MNIEIQEKNQLLSDIEVSITQVLSLAATLDNKTLNKIPYEGSWTAGQLIQHIVNRLMVCQRS